MKSYVSSLRGVAGFSATESSERVPIPQDWPNRAASSLVAVNGNSWHTQRDGRGQKLLLIHGTGSATHTWRDVMPLLAANYDVLAIDLPGHGFSSRLPDGSMTLHSQTQAMSALLRQIEFVPNAIIGHSAGAALAAQMAISNQEASPTVIGINAALEPFGGSLAKLFSPLARAVAVTPLVPSLVTRRARNRDVVRRMLDSTGSRLDDVGLHWYQQLLTREPHVRATIRMMADWDLRSLIEEMEGVADRCHLLVGDRDLAVPPAQANRLKRRYPGIELTHVKTLGHLAHEEDPQFVAMFVHKIMQEQR